MNTIINKNGVVIDNPNTFSLREYLTPLCGWKLDRPDEHCAGWWRKEGKEPVIGTKLPIEDSIEAANQCIPLGFHLIKMEYYVRRPENNIKANVIRDILFLVLNEEDGSTWPLIIPCNDVKLGDPTIEKQMRFHLAIYLHDRQKAKHEQVRN